MKWLSIESAPKDGTSILLLIDDVAIEGSWYTPQYGKPRWYPESLLSHGCGCCGEEDGPATHWCPLPTKE